MFSFNKNGKQYSNFDLEGLRGLVSQGVLSQGEADNLVKSNKKMEIEQLRKAAYSAESDPLYMEWQFDKTAESENAWRDKVTEIKDRYPLPSAR